MTIFQDVALQAVCRRECFAPLVRAGWIDAGVEVRSTLLFLGRERGGRCEIPEKSENLEKSSDFNETWCNRVAMKKRSFDKNMSKKQHDRKIFIT